MTASMRYRPSTNRTTPRRFALFIRAIGCRSIFTQHHVPGVDEIRSGFCDQAIGVVLAFHSQHASGHAFIVGRVIPSDRPCRQPKGRPLWPPVPPKGMRQHGCGVRRAGQRYARWRRPIGGFVDETSVLEAMRGWPQGPPLRLGSWTIVAVEQPCPIRYTCMPAPRGRTPRWPADRDRLHA